MKIRLVAVAGPANAPQERTADHAWTPDGTAFEGPEARLSWQNMAIAPSGETRRSICFELGPQPVKAVPPPTGRDAELDVFAYLPQSNSGAKNAENPGAAGPISIRMWQGGIPHDSAGKAVLAAPSLITINCGLENTDPQDVVFGVAQGPYQTLAKGNVSMPDLAENQTAIMASGPWGSIEITHLQHPQFETRPSPTHRFRLLGGAFPPAQERKLLLLDENGKLLASCGDGPNNPGYMGGMVMSNGGPSKIARFEIQQRPFEFVRFRDVTFNAPHITAYSGQEGLDHAVDSSVGKIIGVLTPTKDGPWSGSVLYAADGVRWLDPGQELVGYEYGLFDPWDHPLDDRWDIVAEPSETVLPPNVANCEIYSADSENGEKREQLTSWNELPFRPSMTTIPCKPTKRPYLRLEVRSGEGNWRTLQSIPVLDKMSRVAETGPLGSRVLSVFFDADGGIRVWTDEQMPVRSSQKWRPGEQRIRALAHLRGGGVAELSFNMSGYGGVPPHENRYSGLECTRQSNGALLLSPAKAIDVKNIAAIDLQVQDLSKQATIFIHSPIHS